MDEATKLSVAHGALNHVNLCMTSLRESVGKMVRSGVPPLEMAKSIDKYILEEVYNKNKPLARYYEILNEGGFNGQ